MTTPSAAQLIIISGPSGVGKTTLTRQLVERLNAVLSISMTTRQPTKEDRPDIDYHFVTNDQFEQAIADDQLLEWAKVFDHYYGTPRQPIEDALASDRYAILEIDVQGAIKTKALYPDAIALFIDPPSEEELLARLRRRGREEEAKIQKRFAKAQTEMQRARSSQAYNAFVINDQLDDAVEQAYQAILSHAH